jgi:hypothetical protein
MPTRRPIGRHVPATARLAVVCSRALSFANAFAIGLKFALSGGKKSGLAPAAPMGVADGGVADGKALGLASDFHDYNASRSALMQQKGQHLAPEQRSGSPWPGSRHRRTA